MSIYSEVPLEEIEFATLGLLDYEKINIKIYGYLRKVARLYTKKPTDALDRVSNFVYT